MKNDVLIEFLENKLDEAIGYAVIYENSVSVIDRITYDTYIVEAKFYDLAIKKLKMLNDFLND